MLQALGVTRNVDLIRGRSGSTVLVGGVKVATQTPPIRSGRRVVFLTVDDGTGPADATFFEDVQGPYAATVFHSWLLLVRGVVRRTGARGLSLRATGAWEITTLWEAWQEGGIEAVRTRLEEVDHLARSRSSEAEAAEAAETAEAAAASGGREGSRRRVLVHASGFRQSPYADIAPAGVGTRSGSGAPPGESVPELGGHGAPRKLWHSSPGSSGH